MTERIIHTAVPTALALNSNSEQPHLSLPPTPARLQRWKCSSRREHKVLPGGDGMDGESVRGRTTDKQHTLKSEWG